MKGMEQMKKQKSEMFILQAREIFIDSNDFGEYELLGYFRLIKALCKKNKTTKIAKIQIASFNEILKSLPDRTHNILKWRFWDCYTRTKIGLMLGVSRERIRQIETSVLERLEWLFENKVNTHKDKMKETIEMLNLKTRGYMALKRAGINTIEQLIDICKNNLLEIKGVGKNVAQDIKLKLDGYVLRDSCSKQQSFVDLPIDSLNLSNRTNNALKRKGIYIIRQLFELSTEQVNTIKGLGKKGVSEVMRVKNEAIVRYHNLEM